MLARIRKSLDEKDQGFTLIELLVVMIIIGILAAIAIPIFLNQRRKAVDSSIKSDLKAAASAIEDWSVDNPNIAVNPTTSIANVRLSTGNVILVTVPAAITTANTGGTYCIRGSNPNSNAPGGATGAFFWYSSSAGGLQSGAPSATNPGGACAA